MQALKRRGLDSAVVGDLIRIPPGTRRRAVQLYLASVALEKPSKLPSYLWRRVARKRRSGASPVERAGGGEPSEEYNPSSTDEATKEKR